MKKTIQWGIIGPGKIAHKFAEGMASVPNTTLYAVASRSKERAESFAHQYNVPKAYDSYVDLVNDPNVDVIYVATTNNFHYEHAKLCIEHNKACVCEKPFTLTVAESEQLISLAKKSNTFLMEALWTRFLPSIDAVEKLIKQGEIGTITHIDVNFGFETQFSQESRLFNPQLGGGALYDIGIYPIFFAMHFLGTPSKISAKAQKTSDGVDVHNRITFEYKNNVTAHLESSFVKDLPCEATIFGTKGKIKFAHMWHCPTQVSLQQGNITRDVEIQYIGNGYNYEIQEVCNCIWQNKKESSKLPLQNTLERIKIINKIISFH